MRIQITNARRVGRVFAACAVLVTCLAVRGDGTRMVHGQGDAAVLGHERGKNSPLLDLPLRFEPNRGQFDERVRYLARGPGYGLYLTDGGATLALANPARGRSTPSAQPLTSGPADPGPAFVTMHLVGGRDVEPSGTDKLSGVSNYLIGNDPSAWRTGVEGYARVRYPQVLPGVDVVYYGTGQRALEYDLVLGAGVDPEQVALSFEGASAIDVNSLGQAVVELVGGGTIVQAPPVAYQVGDTGARVAVAAHYEIRPDGALAFQVGPYDRRNPLVVDPLLSYSSYLGGGGADQGQGVAVDGSGDIYVAGCTTSASLPGGGTLVGGTDAFVTEIDPTLTAIVYSTYLGGSSNDCAYGIAVDYQENAFVVGTTGSANFPAFRALQSNLSGSQDAFVTELDRTGSRFVYSTFLGGSDVEYGYGIALVGDTVAVTGQTNSTNFPVHGTYAMPLQSQTGGGADAFVAVINSGGGSFSYATYLGGSGFDAGTAISIDNNGRVYVVGNTASSDFPMWFGYQRALGGSSTRTSSLMDAFAVVLASDGGSLVSSTYLGGSDNDYGTGVAIDPGGDIYVVGLTGSPDFPTWPPAQSALSGSEDAFVTKLNWSGNAEKLVFSTFWGGSASDWANGVRVDGLGNAYVVGTTWSADFPVAAPLPTAVAAGSSYAFVSEFSAIGKPLFSTYLGATSYNNGTGIAIDATLAPPSPPSTASLLGLAQHIYVTGATAGTLATVVPTQATFGGGSDDALVAEIGLTGYLGCFQDFQTKTQPRDLSGPMVSSVANTPALCVAWCGQQGYPYAGVQDANQCFCGTAYGAYGALPTSRCDVQCTGNTAQNCGGFWANAVYATSALGCFADVPSSRDLPFPVAGSQTPSSCVTACSGMGYHYAGVQLGGLCFCGNAYGQYASTSATCNTPCSADHSQICGGSTANSVYAVESVGCYGNSVTAPDLSGPSVFAATTPSACVAFCAGKGQHFAGIDIGGGHCYCGNSYGKYGASDRCIWCQTDLSQMCGDITTNAIYMTAYVGCFVDKAVRALPTLQQNTATTNTPGSCIQYCNGLGYPYAGVQNGNQCFCGSSYSKYGTATNCNDPCSGDSTQTCGGTWANSVYVTGAPI